MRKLALIAATAAVMAAAPAYASGEGRLEARGGIAFAGGSSKAFAGVGGGYDFDLGKSAILGLDLGADKILANGAKVLWSVGARAGVKTSEDGRLYVNGGIGFCCGTSDAYIGAGYQHKFGDKFYGKIEYRNVLSSGTNVNFAGIGLGMGF